MIRSLKRRRSAMSWTTKYRFSAKQTTAADCITGPPRRPRRGAAKNVNADTSPAAYLGAAPCAFKPAQAIIKRPDARVCDDGLFPERPELWVLK